MKRTLLLLTFIFALTFSLFSCVNAVEFDYRQYEGNPYTLPVVAILSPTSNGLYSVPDVLLNVTIQIRSILYPGNNERIRWLNYSLDGQVPAPMKLTYSSNSNNPNLIPPYNVQGNVVLTSLTDGNHTLTVLGETFVGGLNAYFNETVSFTVDKSIISEPDSLPTSLAIASVITVAVVGVVLLVYFKKYPKRSG